MFFESITVSQTLKELKIHVNVYQSYVIFQQRRGRRPVILQAGYFLVGHKHVANCLPSYSSLSSSKFI